MSRLSVFSIALFALVGAVPLNGQQPQGLEQGLDPQSRYHAGNIDKVNLLTGGLYINAPLVSFPQRGKVTLDFRIRYNSKFWTRLVDQYGNLYYWPATTPSVEIVRDQVATVRDTITVVSYTDYQVIPPVTYSLYEYNDSTVSSDGSSHVNFQSAAGFTNSVPSLDAEGWYTGDRDGIQYVQNNFPGGTTWDIDVTDTNGNQIKSSPSGWTDTLGRLIPASPALPQGASQPTLYPNSEYGRLLPGVATSDLSLCAGGVKAARLWNLPAPSGGTAVYKLCYYDVAVATHFNDVHVADFTGTIRMLGQIVQPDRTNWIFNYDSYGMLSSLQLPTGGILAYTYVVDPNNVSTGINGLGRVVASRSVSGFWNYHYQHISLPSNSSSIQTVVTDPQGNETSRTSGQWSVIQEVLQTFQGGCGCYSGSVLGTLLKTVVTDYVQVGVNNIGPVAPIGGAQLPTKPSQITTIYPNGQVSQKKITYQQPGLYTKPLYIFSDPNFLKYGGTPPTQTVTVDYFSNVLTTADYDFALNTPGVIDPTKLTVGPLLRQTTNTYAWMQSPPNGYFDANLVDLPQSAIISDGSGNKCAETDFTYDDPARISTPSPAVTTQHVTPRWPKRGNLSSTTRQLSATPCAVNATWTGVASYVNVFDTGMIASSTDPMLHVTSYAYSPSFVGAYVTQTTMPDTNSPGLAHHVLNGSYDFNTGLLTSVTDQNGQITSYSYDSMSRITQAVAPAQLLNGVSIKGGTTFSYPDATTVERTQKIDASRTTDMFVYYDGLGREIRRKTANDETTPWDEVDTQYDALGRKHSVTYPYQSQGSGGSSTGDTFAYDALGRVTSVTHSDSSATSTTYTGPAVSVADEGNGSFNVQRISQSDALGRLKAICEVSSVTLLGSSGKPANCALDIVGSGFVTNYSYDPLGNLTSVAQAGLTNRTFTYDSFSRLLSASNPESGKVSYVYDNDGLLIQRKRPKPNQSSSSAFVTTTYSNDELHRPRGTTYVGDSNTPAVTTNYDETSVWSHTLANSIGRKTSEISGSAGGIFGYDPLGRIADQTQCTPQNCATPSTTNWPVSYTYDLLGNALTATNGKGTTITYGYNRAARMVSATSSLSDANHPAALLSAAHYGAFGLIQATVDGSVMNYAKSYYPRGWLQSIQNGINSTAGVTPGTGSVVITGSEQSVNSPTATPSSGTVTINGGEQSVTKYPCGTSSCPTVVWDSGTVSLMVGNRTESCAYGQSSGANTIATCLANAFNGDSGAQVTATISNTNNSVLIFASKAAGAAANYPISSSTFSNDSADFGNGSFSVISTTTMQGGKNAGQNYDAGSLSITVNGFGASTTYGQTSTLFSVASALATALSVASSPVTATATGGTVNIVSKVPGINTNYSLSSTSVTTVPGIFSATSFPNTASGPTLTGGSNITSVYSTSLTYAPDGNIASDNDSVNGNWAYTYDQFNRLGTAVASNVGKGCSFAYDRFGNRWQQNASGGACNAPTYSFTGSNNRIDGKSYDAIGNLLNDGNHAYTYDAENRIIKVDSGTAGTYTYDAGGRRVKSVTAAKNVEFINDLSGHAVTEVTSTGTWNRSELYAAGQHLATYTSAATYFAHVDWLGTERARSGIAGVACLTTTSLPFGDGLTSTGSCNVSPMTFTGKERDAESGLDNFGARYNASTMGRFMTPDPLLNSGRPWNPQTWNRYSYARNNPLSIVDPTGLYDLNNTCAGDDKKCNKQFQQHANDLKKGLENLQKKVDKMKDGTEKTRLGNSLTALGTEGDHNGVNVAFGATKDGSAATTDPVFDQSSGKYSGFNVTIDPSKESNGANGYAIDAAHEGTHVSDYENFELNPATSMQPFQIEYRGYQTSAWAAQALGFDNISYRGIQIWNSSWGAVDRQTLQDRGITNVVNDANHPEVQPHNPFPNQ